MGIEPRLAILQVNHKLVRRAGEASAPEGGVKSATWDQRFYFPSEGRCAGAAGLPALLFVSRQSLWEWSGQRLPVAWKGSFIDWIDYDGERIIDH